MKKFFTATAAALLLGTVSASAALEGIENVYLIGNSTPSGWNNKCATAMTETSKGVYVYEGGLVEGELKFLIQLGEWTPAIMPIMDRSTISKAGVSDPDIYLSENGNPDQKWVVTEPGSYRITLDTNAETIAVAYTGEFPEVIYVMGACTDSWFSNEAYAFICRQPDGKYVWEGELAASSDNKLIKFALQKGDWDKVDFLVPAAVDYNDCVQVVTEGLYTAQKSRETEPGALKDWFWGLQQEHSGIYRVTVDVDALTVDFKLIKNTSVVFDPANVTELYMNGLATGCFDSNDPGQMQSLGNGKWQWKGQLDYATTDEDPNHANKQFKFVTPKGNWDKVWYLIPVDATGDGYIEEIGVGTYPLASCTWLSGRTGKDAFFGLKPGMKGEYTVTVDVPAMTVTLDDGTGIEAIEADDAEAVYYNLQGVRVDNPADGLFVKVCNGKAVKVVK